MRWPDPSATVPRSGSFVLVLLAALAAPKGAVAQGSINALGDALFTGLLAMVVGFIALLFGALSFAARSKSPVRIINGALGVAGAYCSGMLLSVPTGASVGLMVLIISMVSMVLAAFPASPGSDHRMSEAVDDEATKGDPGGQKFER